MQFSSYFQDDFAFHMYKVLLHSVIHVSGTNTSTYIAGFQLHCFFHRVHNRVLLHICPCPAGADELGTGKQRWDQFHHPTATLHAFKCTGNGFVLNQKNTNRI